MSRAGERINSLPPAEQIMISLHQADTMRELVEVTAKNLERELRAYPNRVPGARRNVRTLSVTPEKVTYEIYYVSTTK